MSRSCSSVSSPSLTSPPAPPNSRASELNNRVLCLRPEADFTRVGAPAPASLKVQYCKPDDASVPQIAHESAALVIPAVGPKLAAALLAGSAVKLVQVTGAGVDRLDQADMTRLGIPVCNVPGNSSVAEYAVTA